MNADSAPAAGNELVVDMPWKGMLRGPIVISQGWIVKNITDGELRPVGQFRNITVGTRGNMPLNVLSLPLSRHQPVFCRLAAPPSVYDPLPILVRCP